MKTLLALYVILSLLGYRIGVPVSEREIDIKDCEMWKYGDPEIRDWCLDKEPEIIRELEWINY